MEIEVHQVIGLSMAAWVVGQVIVDARNGRAKRKQAREEALERSFIAMQSMIGGKMQEEEPEDAIVLLAGMGTAKEEQWQTTGIEQLFIPAAQVEEQPLRAKPAHAQGETGLTVEFDQQDILKATAYAEARIVNGKQKREQQKQNFLK